MGPIIDVRGLATIVLSDNYLMSRGIMHVYQVWMYVYLDCSCEHVQHARLVLHSRHSGYSV